MSFQMYNCLSKTAAQAQVHCVIEVHQVNQVLEGHYCTPGLSIYLTQSQTQNVGVSGSCLDLGQHTAAACLMSL